MHVRLTPELKAVVNKQIKSGRYATASELVRDLIRQHGTAESQAEQRELEQLRDDLRTAINDLDAGRGKSVRGTKQLAAYLRSL